MLYKDNITKLMGLEEAIVERVEETSTEHHIYLEMLRKEHPCPRCGERTNKIHDYREQKIRDLPAFGKKTFLHLRKRRYRCPECGKRFCENVPFLQKQHQTTTRVVESLISSYREMKTSKRIAEEHNVSATTAQRYFDTVSIRFKCLPAVLSIDEFRGNAGGEKFQCILTDPQNHKTLDILPNRKSYSLMKYFQGFSTRKSVQYVVMDMSRAFFDVARTCFPDATIVIDRYHVVRQAIWAFENVRKAEQRKFSEYRRKYFKRSRSLLLKHPSSLTEEEADEVAVMLKSSEKLATAYLLKNLFLDVMKSENSTEAANRLKHWFHVTELADLPEFRSCCSAIHNWSKYILHSFDCPYTNGYTEGCNNRTKVLKRICYGVRNFKRFRSRILFMAA